MAFEEAVAFQAEHVGGPQEIEKFIGIGGFDGVVVNHPEQPDAVGQGDEIIPVNLFPLPVEVAPAGDFFLSWESDNGPGEWRPSRAASSSMAGISWPSTFWRSALRLSKLRRRLRYQGR
jgi:hypothetical protein